jgi:hypothetical protein
MSLWQEGWPPPPTTSGRYLLVLQREPFDATSSGMADRTSALEQSDLPGALRLLASPYADLETYLAGYSAFGIYHECITAVRENIGDITEPLRNGLLPPAVAAAIIDCYVLMESLARHPAETNNANAFASHPLWQQVRALALTAAEQIDEQDRK